MRTHGFTRVFEMWEGPETFGRIPLTVSQLMWRREHAWRCWCSPQASEDIELSDALIALGYTVANNTRRRGPAGLGISWGSAGGSR